MRKDKLLLKLKRSLPYEFEIIDNKLYIFRQYYQKKWNFKGMPQLIKKMTKDILGVVNLDNLEMNSKKLDKITKNRIMKIIKEFTEGKK